MPVAAAGAAAGAWIAGAAGATAATVATASAIGAAVAVGAVAGAVIGGATALISGGNFFEGVLKGAVIGGISAGAGEYLAIASGLTAVPAAGASVAADVGAEVGAGAVLDAGTTAAMGSGVDVAIPGLETASGVVGSAQTAPVVAPVSTGVNAGANAAKAAVTQAAKEAPMTMKDFMLANTATQALGGAAQAYGAKKAAEENRELEEKRLSASKVTEAGDLMKTVFSKITVPREWMLPEVNINPAQWAMPTKIGANAGKGLLERTA